MSEVRRRAHSLRTCILQQSGEQHDQRKLTHG
jgi:hypothetical protein